MYSGEDKADTFSRIAALDYEFEEEDFAGVSGEARRFIEQLFTRDPLQRATAKQCLFSDWIRKFTSNQPAINLEQERLENRSKEKHLETLANQRGTNFEKFLLKSSLIFIKSIFRTDTN